MKIPGVNLLGVANRLIATSIIKHYRDTGEISISDDGRTQPVYDLQVVRRANVQPMSLERITYLGLSAGRQYYTWYAPVKTLGPGRDYSGDVILIGDAYYQVTSVTPWDEHDGWSSAILAELKNAPF